MKQNDKNAEKKDEFDVDGFHAIFHANAAAEAGEGGVSSSWYRALLPAVRWKRNRLKPIVISLKIVIMSQPSH